MGIIFLIVLIDLMGFGIIIPLLPFMVPDPEHHPVKVTLLFSIYSICQFIGAPILGAISDRRGRKPVLAFSQFGSAIGYAMLGLALQPQFHLTATGMALGAGIFCRESSTDLPAWKYLHRAGVHQRCHHPGEHAHGPWGSSGWRSGWDSRLVRFWVVCSGKCQPESAGVYRGGNEPRRGVALDRAPARIARHDKPVDVEAWLHPSQFKPLLRKPMIVNLLAMSFITMAAFVMMESTVGIFLKSHYGYGQQHVGYFFGYIGIVIFLVQGGIVRRMVKTVGDFPLAVAGPTLVTIGMVMVHVLGVSTRRSGCCSSPVPPTPPVAVANNQRCRLCWLASVTATSRVWCTACRTDLGVWRRVFGPLIAGFAYPFVNNTGPFIVAGVLTIVRRGAWTAMLWQRSKSQPAIG